MTMTDLAKADAPTGFEPRDAVPHTRHDDAVAAFNARAASHAFSPRQVLIRQGDPADRVFVVDRGRVKSLIRSVEGSNSALEVLGEGQMFGEAALLDGSPHYTTTVTGMDRGQMRSVTRDEFLAWLAEYPQESARLLTNMTRRVTQLTERVESSSLALPKRLARVLLLLLAELGGAGDLDGTRDPLNVSQQDLGDFVGAARESVNRQLRSWEREGLVELRKGRVVVTNTEALTDLSSKA